MKRIEDVLRLRGAQFREDAGPLAHPVRPEEYIEINNFYTATVYEKGAEVIGMLRRLVGPETYSRALDLYFDRHDGQACTIEDWLRVFEDVSGRDLGQFKLWYSQAGTPRLRAVEHWDGARYRLDLSQETPPTPGQPTKAPLLIPVAYGLLDPEGNTVAEGVLELTEARQSFDWTLPERPTLSLLRGFSAPVILERADDPAERVFLLAHDSDPFNKWEAGRTSALILLSRMAEDPAAAPDEDFLAALSAVADDSALDPAFKALALSLPPEDEVIAHMAATGLTPDPLAIWGARRRLEGAVAHALSAPPAGALRRKCCARPLQSGRSGGRQPGAAGAGAGAADGARPGAADAHTQFGAADNMTERMAALALLVAHGEAEAALAEFHATWAHERLVIDKWFSVQAAGTPPEIAVATVDALTRHPDFDWKNPNRFRALIGAFAMGNPAGFHAADGSGYRLLVDWLIRLDPVNPQTTARIAATLGSWRIFDAGRQALMQGELERLAALPGLSRDTGEIVGRLLRGNDA